MGGPPEHFDEREQSLDLAADLHRIVEVEVVGEHRLRLAFDDGVGGELDVSKWNWSDRSHAPFSRLCAATSSGSELRRSVVGR